MLESSSRMCVINHNWSATKQCLHPQSVAAVQCVRGQDSTMWDIIWVSPQGRRSVSVSRHFLLQAPQCPCSVQKGSAETTVAEGGQNPVAGLWGHTLGEN